MNWKEAYNKCNTKKYSQLVDIKQPMRLTANFNNFVNKNKVWAVALVLVIIAVAAASFHYGFKFLLIFMALAIAFTLLFIYYNSYKIIIKNNVMTIEFMFRKYQIKVDDLANIFIDQGSERWTSLFPKYVSTFNVFYFDKKELMSFSLPTLMLNNNELVKFFKCVKFAELEEQQNEDKRISEMRTRGTIKSIIYAFIILLIAIVLVYSLMR